MNVLIINANMNVRPMAVMPLGACLVAEAAERAGHRVGMLDLTFEKDVTGALDRALARSRPAVVGISARNIDNNDMRNPRMFYEDLTPLVRSIREKSEAKIVLGGAGVGIMPEAFLRYTGVDHVVAGNGEFVFPRVLAALQDGGDPSSVSGVAGLAGGEYRFRALDRSEFDAECRAPRFERWIPVGEYLDRFATAPVQTKRGCPFDCVYCTYSIGEGGAWRLCSPESVVSQVRRLVASGLRHIEFVDNVFNAPYDHAAAICTALARARTGARLTTVELNPAFIDDGLFTLMERADFTGVGITAESASDAVLRGLGKNYTAAEVVRSAEVAARHALPCLWMFMFGGPGETPATVDETLRFAAEYVRPRDVAFFNAGVRIYPGTKLERIARAQGVLNVPAGDMLKPITYLSPSVDGDRLVERLKRAISERANFIDADTLSLPYLPLLYRAGRLLGLGHPPWKYVRFLKRGQRLIGANV